MPDVTLPRFYAPDAKAVGAEVALPEAEARHLARVLRIRAGDRIVVFDGRGREWLAAVSMVSRTRVEVVPLEPVEPVQEPPVRLTLAQAVLKGDGMDIAVRDATMLGAEAIVPLVSAHVAVGASALRGEKLLARWERVALASVKQCRRARLPAISEPRPFLEWLTSSTDGPKLLFVEPSAAGGRTITMRALASKPAPGSAVLIVGPEGGWSAAEIDAAVAAGCLPVTLGPLTLRAESMAVAAIIAASVAWDGRN